MSNVVIVGGVIANKPHRGGAAWTRLNWVLGLKKLGFEVHLVEQIAPDCCKDMSGNVCTFSQSESFRYFNEVVEQAGLHETSTLVYDGGKETSGRSLRDLEDIVHEAVLLVNITGHLSLKRLKEPIARKAYVDLDPGFTQFWYDAGYLDQLNGHDFYFTVGENVGKSECLIPTNNFQWHATRQPVVLEQWPPSTQGQSTRFTTVAAWRGPYGVVNVDGRRFGVKAHEFRKFAELPQMVSGQFEIALDIDDADVKDRQLLESRGWNLVDPRAAAGDPKTFQTYIQESGAEFSVAKEIYVETRSGWFSDRSVRYLASGKPVLIQDTGVNYPLGNGLLAFRTLDQATAGAHSILNNYRSHCAAARQIAEEYFDSDKVLGSFIDKVDVCP